MAGRLLWSLFVALAILCPQTTAAIAADFNSTVFSLVYGSPLISYYQYVQRYSILAPPNEIYHARSFVNAITQVVVESNVDTLYSFMAIDLSTEDLVLTVPNIATDQYYLFSFFDVFGDDFAAFGLLDGSASGNYLIRRASDVSTNPGMELSTTVNGVQYSGIIDFSGSFGILLIRWLIKNSASYAPVYAYQNSTTVKPLPRPVNDTSANSLKGFLGTTITGNNSVDILNLLAHAVVDNPPEESSDNALVAASLSGAGINNGAYTPVTDVNLSLAQTAAQALSIAAFLAPGTVTTLNNNWSMIALDKIADYKSNYGLRAALGSSSYAASRAPGVIYPFWETQNLSPTVLAQNMSVIYSFSGKPPILQYGFWSITLYNSSGFFVNNPLNVYALGDRSNLTFSDGSLVYGGSKDGPFQILVQAADNPPPSNWTGNWLPAPTGGGAFKALLRFYGPGGPLLNGSYQYPLVTMHAAITKSSSGNGSGGSTNSTTGPMSAAPRLRSGYSGLMLAAVGLVAVSYFL